MSSLKSVNFKIITNLFSDENLTKKASLNALASGIDYGARLLVGFLITPLMVAGLGNFYFGVWQFLMRLIGYLSPASGRATQALKWTLANQQTSPNYIEKRQHVGSALAVWAIFLPILTVLGAILSWFVPIWLDAPDQDYWTIRLAAGIIVLNLVATSLAEMPRSVLEGENLGYKRMGLSAILVFVGGGLTWLSLYFDFGIIGVAAATLATTLLTGILFLQVVRSYTPWFGVAKPSSKAVRSFLGLSWWFLGWHLIMRLMLASDVVILGLFNSVESVTTYTLTKYAPETLISIVAILVFGIIPGLGGIIGLGDLEKATRVRNEIMALTWLIITALGSTILLWNWAFVRLWVGADHYAGVIPTLMIVIVIIQFVLIRNDANIIDLTLDLNRKVIIGGISVTISFVAAAIFVDFFNLGIVGLCLGIIIGRIILTIGYPLIVGRFLGVPLLSQIKGILRPTIVTSLFLVITLLLSETLVTIEWFITRGWIALGLSVGLSFSVILLLAFFIGFTGDQRRHILRRVRTVISVTEN